MMQHQPDESLINMIAGNNANHGLVDLKVQLCLIQSACTLALEGITRATASQIAAKAFQSYKIEITASFTGQTFSNLNIASVTTHGKNRFVLDADELEEIRKDIASQCEKSLARLQTAIDNFQELPQRIDELQNDWKKTVTLRAREQELIRLINADRQNPPRLDYLEAEYKKIKQRNEYISQIQKEAKALALKEKRLPSFEEKKKKLEMKIADQEKRIRLLNEKDREIAVKEQELNEKETAQAKRIEKLVYRSGWVELATLNQEIEAAQKELKQLSKQLGEKRSLLDRLLHRKEDGQ